MAARKQAPRPACEPLTDRERFHAETDHAEGIFPTLQHAEAFRFELRDDPALFRRYMLARMHGTPY